MADNVLVNEATTAVQIPIATDDIGGVQHELVKIEFGQDGSATMVSAIDPLPVTGTITVTPSGTQDENLKQVNGASVNVGAGASSTGTQRVITATDSTIGTVSLNSDVRQGTAANLNATVVQGTATSLKTQAEQYVGGTAVSSSNPVPTTEVAPTTIFTGKTTVTTAGTRVALASSQAVKSVTVKALSTNTGLIFVGNSAVASTNGFQLSAYESVSFDIANLATVFIDSSVNTEGVSYIGIN